MEATACTLGVLVALLELAPSARADDVDVQSLVVTATAYNSLPSQTGDHPDVGAWGDGLEPGMRVIAVSHDLLSLGLTRGVEVSIDGLPGSYTVLDKMDERWRRRIDVYMGVDVDAALRWGVRKVRIEW